MNELKYNVIRNPNRSERRKPSIKVLMPILWYIKESKVAIPLIALRHPNRRLEFCIDMIISILCRLKKTVLKSGDLLDFFLTTYYRQCFFLSWTFYKVQFFFFRLKLFQPALFTYYFSDVMKTTTSYQFILFGTE